MLLETLTTGGAELFAVRLANALAAEHEVCLAVMHGERIDAPARALLDRHVKVEALKLPAKRWWFRADTGLRRLGIDRSFIRRAQQRWLERLVGDFRPNLVHSHLLKADRLAHDVRTATAYHFAHVLTMHGDYEDFLNGTADPQMLHVAPVARTILGYADSVVAICEPHRRFLLEFVPSAKDRIKLIVNGYAPTTSGDGLALPISAFRFGMVSRGVRLKGWDVAIEAFQQLARPDASLTLVGGGPYLDEVGRRTLPPGVHLSGATSDPLAAIAQFDVCLLPTLFPHESLPTVIIEYLWCGKPVIATDVGDIRNMLTAPDGSSAGSLLPMVDGNVSASECAASMAALMDDRALRAQMSRSAAACASRFDMSRCVEAYVALYRSCANEVRSTSSTKANH